MQTQFVHAGPARVIFYGALFILIGIAAFVFGTRGAAQIPEGWFPWPAVEPVTGSAVDVSHLNAGPGGGLSRIAVQNGQFVTAQGERIRFWGCNLAAEVAFPPIDDIEPLARRLAKGGVNIARLHHLDNPWAVQKGGSLWPSDRADHRQIDPKQLDRLHRLVAALRDQGIYSNVNLKVSKTLSPEDGFADSVRDLPLFQKRVDIFDRRMIELQKEYARQLLTAKNPYTGLTLAEDPAVAVIEITNENSLLGFWTRDLGRGLDKLPEPFRSDLTAQWNTWLTQRHGTDEAITLAWSGPAARPDTGASLLPPAATWQAKTVGNVSLHITPGPDATAVEIDVGNPSGTDWHAQLSLRGVALRDGEIYTLSFAARADRKRPISVGVGLDQQGRPGESWRGFGLLDTTEIDTEWTPVRFVFAAHSVNGAPAALQLNAGAVAGRIAVKDFKLERGADGVGLQAGQSARAGTVPIPTVASQRQWADWIHFLADTERAFADEMRHFLKDELGVTAPIIGSQVEYGGLAGAWREQAMDFADSHAYWQHPDLENGSFESAKWTIRNSPQIAVFGERQFGEFGNRAFLRIANKPFAISEYDHSAPSEFACEMYPTLATFACRQDWDAMYPFDIGFNASRNPNQRIGRFFDNLNHPAKWGQGPFAALVFREGLIAPAPEKVTLTPGSPLWAEQPHSDLLFQRLIPDGSFDFLNVRYAMSDQPAGTLATLQREGVPGKPPVTVQRAPQGQVYVIDAERAAGAIGFIGGATIDAGALRVTCDRFGRDFAAVTAVALDAKPLHESERVLVTVVGRAQNQGITWNTERTTVGAEWGHGPPITEHVPATMTLRGMGGRVVHVLAPDGTRTKTISAESTNGDLTFVVGPEDHTIHYEIVGPAGGQGTS